MEQCIYTMERRAVMPPVAPVGAPCPPVSVAAAGFHQLAHRGFAYSAYQVQATFEPDTRKDWTNGIRPMGTTILGSARHLGSSPT